MPNGFPSKPHRQGFVLMYVLGILVILATLVTGGSLFNRQRLSAVGANKGLQQVEFALKGAMQAVVAKLALDREFVEWAASNPSAAGQLKMPEAWVPAEGVRTMLLDGRVFEVVVQRAEWLPDANLLTESEWAGLMREVGVPATTAKLLARHIAVKRDHLQSINGRGFTSHVQVLDGLPLPPGPLFGHQETQMPGLVDLFSVMTGVRSTDPVHTPWIVYRGLYNASDSQITRLQAKRSAGLLTKAQEAEILGVVVDPTSKPSTPSRTFLRVTISLGGQLFRSSITLLGQISLQAEKATVQTEYLFFRE